MLLRNQQQFLRELFRIGAIKVDIKDRFELAVHRVDPKAPRSPIYINLRTPDNPKKGPLMPIHVRSIATDILSAVRRAHISYDAIAGVPRAGVPFALEMNRLHAIAGAKSVPYLLLSKGRKKRGGGETTSLQVDSKSRRRIEGNVKSVLIIDDLMTSGTMKFAAVEAVRRAGFTVAGIAVYLDRQQGGMRQMASAGIRAVSVIGFDAMLKFYRDEGLISAKEYAAIYEYLRFQS